VGTLRNRLLLFILPLCLLPLIGISVFSYFVAKERITQDRIVLYLQQIAAEEADAIQLTLLEKKEETVSMTLYGEFRDYLTGRTEEPPSLLLDKLVLVHEVYDVIILFDIDGNLVLTNSIDRNSNQDVIEYLNATELESLKGQSLLRYTPDSEWLQQVRSSRFGYIDWHMSPLVHKLYRYLDNDIAKQYSIGFAAPILDERNVVVGGILALMNWEFIQEMLDKVEEDLQARSLGSGYAFMFDKDQNTIIGHKYRRNRKYPSLTAREYAAAVDNYGTRLVEDHNLTGLREAIQKGLPYFEYEYPPGTYKISGLSILNNEFFTWVVGVGIDNEDIFAPVRQLRTILISAASATILLVIFLTYRVARRITIPLNELNQGAKLLASGDFSRRIAVRGKDETAQLARSFNEMAGSLEQRSRELIELNRMLEEKVKDRTRELESANQEMEKAYHELKETQFQLVQSEKLASLGQLVAGIAHEIKNPLNFIYGNTDFLRRYVEQLDGLVKLYEDSASMAKADTERIEEYKEEINYGFLREDLASLIDNFEEGAKRIHSIISDLRTFSRMESGDLRPADVHESLDLALSLLQNEYRDRIEVIKDYGNLPKIECHPGRLNQVFMNLLLNACQAVKGPGTIRIETRQDGEFVVLKVRDSGEGIDPENRDRIFEPFFTTKPVGTGTGLGLSVSYAIIRDHKGTITVESEKGKGTEFTIRLPIAK
jgi:signal transduction histidine kinase